MYEIGTDIFTLSDFQCSTVCPHWQPMSQVRCWLIGHLFALVNIYVLVHTLTGCLALTGQCRKRDMEVTKLSKQWAATVYCGLHIQYSHHQM